MNGVTLFGFLSCLVFISSGYPINVKIVKETNNLSQNVDHNNFKAKSQPSNFTGPSHLSYFVGKCFSYSSDKYEYRVCPFDNVTQHEKVWHSGAYNGVIGIWKEWTVKNNSFDSLVFADGDDCEDNVERSAQLIWICGQSVNETIGKVIDIKEPKKCFYEISFASDLGCEDHFIYPHLNEEYQQKWDQIETNYFYKELTQLGYEWALRELFISAAIILNTTNDSVRQINFESKDKCLEEFVLIKEQNVKLEQRVKFLEKQLKNKSD